MYHVTTRKIPGRLPKIQKKPTRLKKRHSGQGCLLYLLLLLSSTFITCSDNQSRHVEEVMGKYKKINIENTTIYYIITIEGHDYISPCLGCSAGVLIHSENCQHKKCNNETTQRQK